MRRLAHAPLLLGLVLALPSLAAAPAARVDPSAQAQKELARLKKELAPVRALELSEPLVKKLTATLTALAARVGTDAALLAEVTSLTSEEEDQLAVSERVARLERTKRLAAIIREQGLSAKEYAHGTLALAWAVESAAKGAPAAGSPADATASAQQVRFVKEHPAAVKAFQSATQRYGAAVEKAEDAADGEAQ